MMPAYNFQKQFAPMILDGSKHHTVRPRRKNPTKAGDRLVLYTGMRTKKCEKIFETKCTATVPIQIYPEIGQIVLDGRQLTAQEVVMFAGRDGFPDVYKFFEFFKRYPFHILCNDLEVIYWK